VYSPSTLPEGLIAPDGPGYCGGQRISSLWSTSQCTSLLDMYIESTERILSVGPTTGVDMYCPVYNGAELTEIG
jgi:hypothetical protein